MLTKIELDYDSNGRIFFDSGTELPKEICLILEKVMNTAMNRNRDNPEALVKELPELMESTISAMISSGLVSRNFDGKILFHQKNLEKYYSTCYQ